MWQAKQRAGYQTRGAGTLLDQISCWSIRTVQCGQRAKRVRVEAATTAPNTTTTVVCAWVRVLFIARVGFPAVWGSARLGSGGPRVLVYIYICRGLPACVRHDRAFSLPQELFLKLAARGGGHALASLYVSARELELACTARPRHSVTTLPPRP